MQRKYELRQQGEDSSDDEDEKYIKQQAHERRQQAFQEKRFLHANRKKERENQWLEDFPAFRDQVQPSPSLSVVI